MLISFKMFFLIVFVVIPFNLLEDYSISCEYCEVQVHMINCFDLTHFKLDVCKRLFIISPFILLCFIDFFIFQDLEDAKKSNSNKSFSDQQHQQQQFTTDNNIESAPVIDNNTETQTDSEDKDNVESQPKIKTIKSKKYYPNTTTQELQADSRKEGKSLIDGVNCK